MKEILRPIGDRIVVERIEEERKSPGGLLVIPDAAKVDTFRAKVLAVGPGSILDNGRHKPMATKPGDVVLIARHFGTFFDLGEGRKVLVIGEGDALGVIEAA